VMRLARNVLRVVGAVTDLVVPPKALLTDPGFAAAQLNEHEAEHDGLESSHTSAPGQADGPVVAGTPAPDGTWLHCETVYVLGFGGTNCFRVKPVPTHVDPRGWVPA